MGLPRNPAGQVTDPAASANDIVRVVWGAEPPPGKLLADAREEINACDNLGLSPLSAAALAGNAAAVRALIEHGADPNLTCGESGLAPLQTLFAPLLASAAEDAKTQGEDIEIIPPPRPPGVAYGSAVDREQRASIAGALLAADADPNGSEDDFNYPLRLALLSGEAHLVEILMNHGANPELPRHLSVSARLTGNGHLLPLLKRRVTRDPG